LTLNWARVLPLGHPQGPTNLPRKWLAGADREVRACVFCPYCEQEDQHHRVVTCCLWPKDPASPRRHLTPGVWSAGAHDPKAVFEAPAVPLA
jgi:hypothetical protein